MRFLLLLLLATPCPALEELVIGPGGVPWTEARETARFVQVAPESLWTWDTQPDQNLSPNILARGGSIHAVMEEVVNVPGGKAKELRARNVGNLPSLQYLIDGDEGTAFDPDEAGVPRVMEIYLDLGGTFRLDQTRIFPRLDNQHRQLFPQAFSLAIDEGDDESYTLIFKTAFFSTGVPTGGYFETLRNSPYTPLLYFSPARPNKKSVVDWPGTLQVTGLRQARYVRLQTLTNLPWELAELELYSDGTIPEGEFISRPLLAGGDPVWGRVRYEGGELKDLPIVLQTRAGPDEEPFLYFILVGERQVQVIRAAWEVIEGIEGAAIKGPVQPNPGWSSWQTVEDGIVRSPGPNRYIQFRLRMLQPGVKIEQLIFEYDTRALVRALQAEISPLTVDPGRETPFVLSAVIATGGSDTGFRHLQVLTPAEIISVDSLRIDDQPVVYTLTQEPGQGFTLNLWERLLKDGSFAQLFFRARVFADGTPFAVRGLDRRLAPGEADTAFQFAREGDVDPLSLGAGLVVRLNSVENPLLTPLQPRAAAFTPNGDGINDFFSVEYDLLKLTRPAPVYFEIFDLSGQRVRQGYAGADLIGQYTRIWDGRDDRGQLALPGLYLYRIQVRADAGTSSRQGVVQVGY